jgi:cytochrome c2
MRVRFPGLLLTILLLPAWATAADEPTPAERGRKALLERSYNPAIWSTDAYKGVWKLWENAGKEPPADFDRLLRERYGLHDAPYPNGGLPMGLREGQMLLGKGVSVDCLVCHGGSVAGKSHVGLGNTALDIQALFEEMNGAAGLGRRTPFRFSNARGTSEAAAMAVFLLGFRNPDLSFRTSRLDLGLHDDLCEDVPAWWLLKKKKTMYHTGGADARSVRSLMQFMTGSLNGPAVFRKEEAAFRDIQAYLLSLEPPKYPLPVDREVAARGETLFKKQCASCHGTYGTEWTYPNKVIPIEEIGTDRRRFDGLEERYGRYYNTSWFAKEKEGWLFDGGTAIPTDGYQAPPLDGIWATAPYLHNGSVPTVYGVLNSKARPARYTRSFKTDLSEFDPKQLGWKVTTVDRPPAKDAPGVERRRVYDTSQTGRNNTGHTYGDDLTDDDRFAIIEYLKTL